MPDPFEEPAVPAPQPPPQGTPASSPVREPFVLQAVNFLNNPLVKAADPAQAVSFLRTKGIHDAEIREAFRRTGLPFPTHFPSAPAGPPPPMPAGPAHLPPPPHFPHPHHPHPPIPFAPLPPPPPPERRTRPTWLSLVLGVAAAGGLYAATRELLRAYVVPLYFPEVAGRADAQQRRRQQQQQQQQQQQYHARLQSPHDATRDTATTPFDVVGVGAGSSGTQLEELRMQVGQLCASSRQTSEQVAELSRALSAEREMVREAVSQTSELRDAIRQLTHSISASGGTAPGAASLVGTSGRVDGVVAGGGGDVAHTAASSAGGARNAPPFARGFARGASFAEDSGADAPVHGTKSGSLAYGLSERRLYAGSRGVYGESVTGVVHDNSGAGIAETQTHTQTAVTGSSERDGRASGRNEARGHDGGVDDDNDAFMALKPAEVEEGWARVLGESKVSDSGGRESVGGNSGDASRSPNGVTQATNEDWSAREDSAGVEASATNPDDDDLVALVDRDGVDDDDPAKGSRVAAARQVFEADVAMQADEALRDARSAQNAAKRGRPLSLPALDAPLSDVE